MLSPQQLLIRPGAAVMREGVAVPAPPGGEPDVTLFWERQGRKTTVLEFAVSAPEVEEILIQPLEATPRHADLKRALARRGFGGPRRRALAVHALGDLVPAVQAADGEEASRPKPRIPAAPLSLPGLLRAVDHPFGYLVPKRGCAYGLVPRHDGQPASQGGNRYYDVVRSFHTRRQLEQRVEKVLSEFYERHRNRVGDALVRQLGEFGARGLGGPCALYKGRSLSVWLEAEDQLTLRRTRPQWDVQSDGTRCRLPDLQYQISAKLGPNGVPRFAVPVLLVSGCAEGGPARKSPVCIANWDSRNPSWAVRGLELLQRAEEVHLILCTSAARGRTAAR